MTDRLQQTTITTMRISLYDHALDTVPKTGPSDWHLLVSALITTAYTVPHPGPIMLGADWRSDVKAKEWKKVKKTMGGWSPVCLAGTRLDANVISMSAYVADLDSVSEETIRDFCARAKTLGWTYLLQPTPSDDPSSDRRRYRAVLPFNDEVPPGKVLAIREACASILGLSGAVDKNTDDLSRFYFFACKREDGNPCESIFEEGTPVDVQTVERLAGVDLIVRVMCSPGERHTTHKDLSGGLIKSGVDPEQAVQILCAVGRACGDEDEPKRRALVERAVVMHADNEPLVGWGELASRFGSDMVSRVRSFLGAAGSMASKSSIVVTARLFEMTRQAVRALGSASNLYRREFRLVRVLHERPIDKLTGLPKNETLCAIVPVDADVLRVILSEVARFTRETKKGDWTEVPPPESLIRGLCALGQWESLSYLSGVVQSPCLRHDGSVLCQPGFDEATGFLFESETHFGAPPVNPTQAEASESLARLVDLVGDFPWKDRAAGPYVWVAGLLTLLSRAMYTTTPIFGIGASKRSSGKTMLTDVASLIACGRSAPRTTFHGPDSEETTKQVNSIALEARPYVLFDNVKMPFGGATIDTVATTEGRLSFRILGQTKNVEPEWKAVIFVNGNQLSFVGDTDSRCLLGQLETAEELPEERTDFKHADLLIYVKANRAAYVRDALTVLRAFIVSGGYSPSRPRDVKGVAGRFPGWASVVPAAIAYAGGPDVCAVSSAVHTEDANDESENQRQLFAALREAFPDGALTKEIVKNCWPIDGVPVKPRFVALTDLIESMTAVRGRETPTAKQVAGLLRRSLNVTRDGYYLRSVKMPSGDVKMWKMVGGA